MNSQRKQRLIEDAKKLHAAGLSYRAISSILLSTPNNHETIRRWIHDEPDNFGTTPTIENAKKLHAAGFSCLQISILFFGTSQKRAIIFKWIFSN